MICYCTHRRTSRRSGKTLVLFALLLPLVLGMVGMVLDTGQLLVMHRQAQNDADAAALAFARAVQTGQSIAQAQVTASSVVQLPPTLNCPPQQGPYAGNPSYFEAVVTRSVTTWFIHVGGSEQTVPIRAHAVAGLEPDPETQLNQVYLVQ